MTGMDAYLEQVRRRMVGMDPRVRQDILRELRSHLADAIADGGERAVLSALEPPASVAARYKDVYGYGLPFQAMFVAAAMALAVLTVPILGLAEPLASIASVGLLTLLVSYLLALAVKAGAVVGLAAGVAACIVRVGTVVTLQVIVALAPVTDARGWMLFAIASLLLIPIGYLPGRAKEKWTRRDVTF